jgi:hypothetical protein
VEFLKQIEILSNQPYHLIYFFNEVMRLVVRENHWLQSFLVNRLVRKIRLKIRFVETITILFQKIRLMYYCYYFIF